MILDISSKRNLEVAPSWRDRNVRSVDNGVAGHQSWTVTEKGIGIRHVVEELRMGCPITVNQGSCRDLNSNWRQNLQKSIELNGQVPAGVGVPTFSGGAAYSPMVTSWSVCQRCFPPTLTLKLSSLVDSTSADSMLGTYTGMLNVSRLMSLLMSRAAKVAFEC